MKQSIRNKRKQGKDVSRELQVMLKRAVNTKVPVIVDTPPSVMVPKAVHLSQEELDLYNFEMVKSANMNITPIPQARESVRFNKALNAFRQAGVQANTYTHIGYYQIPKEDEDDRVKQYRYMLLW
ncbi:MAG: hypothetical protein RR202_08560 [Bacteroidales bacterium]